MNLNELVTVDFETYFDSKYSLRAKKYNLSSYIRDEQFAEHCIAIKIGKKPSKCYPAAKGIAVLQRIDWGTHDLLCHNTAFDGAILAWHHGIVPRKYYDTLSMSRALHSEYTSKSLGEIGKLYEIGGKLDDGSVLDKVKGVRPENVPPKVMEQLMDYCNRDNELCFQIFEKQVAMYPEDELELIDLTLRMFITPIFKLDVPRCEKALDDATRERQVGIAVGCHAAGLDSEKDLTSNIKFVAALKKLGVDAPTKRSKYNGELTYALSESDEEFIDLLQHEDARVVRLVQGRLAAKSTIGETRAARLLDAGNNGMSIPVLLNYYGAKTGRWSGGNKLNFQNFPRGGELRRSIIAPEGHVVVVADSAQIEARGVNWVADNQSMLDVFRAKGDPYCHTASNIYGRKITKDDKDERFIGKIATLGLGYGMGAGKFQTTLALGSMGPAVDMPLNECNKIVTKFRQSNKPIVQYWYAIDKILALMARGEEGEFGVLRYDADGLWLPNGMGILYPGLRAKHDPQTDRTNFEYFSKGVWKKLYGGLVTENIVQALSGVIIRQQMLWYAEYLRSLKLRKNERAMIATMTHDEIVSVVPERLAEKATKKKLEIMRTSPDWCSDLPLDAEGGFDKNYSK